MIRGSCLCGGVRFEIEAARSLTHCHCVNCRKLTGATFASYVHVDVSKFPRAETEAAGVSSVADHRSNPSA
jgi:hypothetical protein